MTTLRLTVTAGVLIEAEAAEGATVAAADAVRDVEVAEEDGSVGLMRMEVALPVRLGNGAVGGGVPTPLPEEMVDAAVLTMGGAATARWGVGLLVGTIGEAAATEVEVVEGCETVVGGNGGIGFASECKKTCMSRNAGMRTDMSLVMGLLSPGLGNVSSK